MKKVITNNLGLKIGSIILAVVVWFLVVNASDPVRTVSFPEIPITVANSAYVESMGQSYQLTEQDSVRVTIRDTSSIVTSIEPEDIVVTADLTQIINLNTDPVMVPLTVSCSKYPNLKTENISISPQNVAIELEKLSSADFVITPSAGETKPDKEVEVGEMQTNPERITVNGPESIINKIDRVVAQVDVSGITHDRELPGKIVIYDKNQEALSEYQMNYLTLSDVQNDQTVSVSVKLWQRRSDVAIKASASGKPASGYQIAEVESTPSTITVAGSEEALQKLSEAGNVIEIPADEVDATGRRADFETRIDISGALPEDIRLATDVSSTILITTTILPYGTKAYDVPTVNIEQQNLGSNLRAVFDREKVQVRVKGSDGQLEALYAETIRGTVDLSGLGTGTYVVPVQVLLPEGLELGSEPAVSITISDVTAESVATTASLTSKSN